MGKKGKIGKQRKDKFYHLAKETGYRSRAAFKLIQLNRKFEFLQKSKVLIDLCAAPGGWLQVAQKHMPVQSIIVGVDLAPIKPIHNVITLQEDITTQKCRSLISKELKTWKVDVVLNDGAPNVGKSWLHDAFEQNRLTLSALHLACDFLMKGGWFITKVFRSKDYNSLMWVFKKLFQRVHATKPQASRNESAEIFVVCQNFIAPDKIDPKFFDPTFVFAEIKDKEHKMTKADLLKPLTKNKKAKPEGYEEGKLAVFHKTNSSLFIQSPDYIELLSKSNEIVLDMNEIKNHPSTTGEIIECIKDLKVLGRKELTMLMNWRKALRVDLVKREPNSYVNEDIEIEEEKGEEENDVEEIDAEQSEEAQRLKRKKRKVAKEKRKIEERLNLKMIIKNDLLVQEEQDLFSLKNIRKASQLNTIKDVEPDHDDYQVDLDSEPRPKKSRIQYDKDQDYYDPDESDAVDSDDELDQNNQLLENAEVDDDDDDDENDNQNGILVDLEDKNEKVKNLTKMFFENKIFHRLESSDPDLLNGAADDLDDDDDIELEELENRISNVTSSKSKVENGKVLEKADSSIMPARKVTFDGDESDSSDSDDDNVEEKPQSVGHKVLTPEELALGTMMIKSKKTKRDLLDNGWNRYVHEDDDMLPSWFRKEEEAYYRKPIPVSSEMVKEYNDKLRDLNSRPIKKVMEAKARKKKRALRRLEKARLKAESVTEEADMTNKEKAQYIRSIYKKAVKKDKDKVAVVVGKRAHGNRRPPGVKGRYKVVDSRLKKDKRKQDQMDKGKKGRKGGKAPAAGRKGGKSKPGRK